MPTSSNITEVNALLSLFWHTRNSRISKYDNDNDDNVNDVFCEKHNVIIMKNANKPQPFNAVPHQRSFAPVKESIVKPPPRTGTVDFPTQSHPKENS